VGADDPAGFGMSAMAAFSVPGPRADTGTEPVGRERPLPSSAVLAGTRLTLDASGAIYLAGERTLIVSDLHLETGSSHARHGRMLPPYDSAMTLARLAEVAGFYLPRRIVSLGDSFHDPFGPERLAPGDRDALAALCAAAEMVWVTGNHDGACAATFGGTVCESLAIGGITLRHMPSAGELKGAEIAGHLHPAARIVVRGRALRRRAFIGCARRLVMPAFGCLTGGLDVADPAFASLWREGAPPRVHMIGSRRVYSL